MNHLKEPVSVLKIGGSILSSSGDFQKIVSMLECRKSEKIVIVVSALKGVTDLLIECAESAGKGKEFNAKFEQLRQKHYNALSQVQTGIAEKAMVELNERLDFIKGILENIRAEGEISARERDLVETFGERLSAFLVAEMLNSAGLKAKAFESQDIGMLTDGNFGKARALLERIRQNVQEKVSLNNGCIPVITGFYGASENGDITSFGRGGSDYSAALIAEALNAETLELWKDVDGFMTADPKIAQKARLQKCLSYDEAEELGVFGAKIIHPKTVTPLRTGGTVLKVKNISKPEADGTIVSANAENNSTVSSIAFKKEVSLITVRSPELLESGTAARLFDAIAKAGVNIDLISTSEIGISISSKRSDCEKAVLALQTQLQNEKIVSENNVSLVSVIGSGMKSTPGIAGRVFTTLGNNGVNVKAISQIASENNITFITSQDYLEKAVLALHEEFFEKEGLKSEKN